MTYKDLCFGKRQRVKVPLFLDIREILEREELLKMEARELDELMNSIWKDLQSLGIPVSEKIIPQVTVNTRAKRRLGCSILREGVYTIEVSSRILDQPELLRQTLVHELLHTCWGCRNHGARWKAYAQRVNDAWGLSVERTVKTQEALAPLREEKVRYVLECTSCGAKYPRSRMSKAVKMPQRYRCRCGGRLQRIL